MSQLVSYERIGRAARLRMDDGKVNAMSPALLGELHAAFDRAAAEQAIVVLEGRDTVFSAGFDLKLIATGSAQEIHTMLRLGGELALKILSFPTPVITVTRGHAYPMGAFLMLAADWRIGAEGDWRTGLNEVRIGMTVPGFALEVARQRLTPAWFSRTVMTGEMFGPQAAREAGFVDVVLPPAEVEPAIQAAIVRMEALDPASHTATKRAARAASITAMRAAIDAEQTLERAERSVARRAA